MANTSVHKAPPSYKAVLSRFNAADDHLKGYFESLPALVKDYVYEVPIAYAFFKTERAHRRALHGGAVKIHRVDAFIAESVIYGWDMKRAEFESRFQAIFSAPISPAALVHVRYAEQVRDKVVHGKTPGQEEMRKALVAILEYATMLNGQVQNLAGFRPFGDMRGFKGRAVSLKADTSRLVLKGLGFPG